MAEESNGYSDMLRTASLLYSIKIHYQFHNSHYSKKLITRSISLFNVQPICLDAFVATKVAKIFLGRKPHQGVKIFHFRDGICLHLQSATDNLMPCSLAYPSVDWAAVWANPVSRQSQEIDELGLGCLCMAVQSVLVYWLLAATFTLLWRSWLHIRQTQLTLHPKPQPDSKASSHQQHTEDGTVCPEMKENFYTLMQQYAQQGFIEVQSLTQDMSWRYTGPKMALPGKKTKSDVITGDRGRRGLLGPWAS